MQLGINSLGWNIHDRHTRTKRPLVDIEGDSTDGHNRLRELADAANDIACPTI
jgi:hypothetical protein